VFEDLKSVFDQEALQVLGVVMVKLGIGALLGGAIGYEREISGRPAGIRTHMLLVLGVVLFSEVSKGWGGPDSSRIAAQIVTGVGFLGAGTILRMGIEIKGLTSAASLWAASAIGMAVSVGGGYILVAVVGTVLTLVTLAYISKLERKLVPYAHPVAMQVELDGPDRIAALMESVQAAGGRVKGMRIVSTDPMHIQLDVTGEHDRCMAAVAKTQGVQATGWMD
jgi:putative Mg2+ transporter-C (MgtC) family protein